ncbi:MAG: T9SS type A sorting domain-containing protein [Candidatus Delongbacteria bacterium]|nr:T9SS type A sorting domain-containing protein [Candidatus Delongbacteria bacterium]MBN2835991.1 T9SS type A sorting domain-containing protein [Candidatus Delongbacteria bacterium]
MKIIAIAIVALVGFAFGYANHYTNGSNVPGNWNGSYLTDKYGNQYCRSCHSSGPSNGQKNLVLTTTQVEVNINEEITFTYEVAPGYNPPFHPGAGKIMGVYLMSVDGSTVDMPQNKGWEIIEDPNSNTTKFNYNERADGSLVWTWTLKAPETAGTYTLKAYAFVGNNDYEQSENIDILVNPVGIDENLASNMNISNYPNPFNPTTTIELKSDVEDYGKLNVVNAKGEIVAEVYNGKLSSGIHSFNFDGSRLISGVYFVKFSGINQELSRKMILVK